MDQQFANTLIAAAIPTLGIVLAIIRNESTSNALAARITSLDTRITSLDASLSARITSLETRLDHRIETLDRDLRDWAKIVMAHNTDISRLKDKAGIE